MGERIGNIGYFRLEKQASPTVAINTAGDYIPLYEESMQTNLNLQRQQPIYGSKFATYGVLQGIRAHTGEVTVMGEPNTAARLYDMHLTKGTTTGSGPYTHPYTLSNSTDPKSYTVDISTGNYVTRFVGVGASSISPDWDNNEMRLKLSLSALYSFTGREIASVASNVITLKTDYDAAPTKGLVAGDLIRIFPANGDTAIDTTVISITATTVTVGAAGAAAASGMLCLRPATPSFALLQPFLFSKTEFRFGVDAATALSATHTPLDDGSTWETMHSFNSDEGEKRSGSFDPASLVRTTGDAAFTAKQFFDTPEAVRRWNALEKQSVVMRCFAGSTNQYELRVTLNHLKTDGTVKPNIQPGAVNYSELEYIPQVDLTDGQGMDVKVINALATI